MTDSGVSDRQCSHGRHIQNADGNVNIIDYIAFNLLAYIPGIKPIIVFSSCSHIGHCLLPTGKAFEIYFVCILLTNNL